MERPVILVPIGDVCGIGPEIVCKSFADGSALAYSRPVAMGDRAVRELAQPCDATGEQGVLEMVQATALSLAQPRPGTVNALAGQAAYDFIEASVRHPGAYAGLHPPVRAGQNKAGAVSMIEAIRLASVYCDACK